ncbi:hypothetical protein RJ639_003925 [Escallonia herrerae]|uniref:Uncharacterized protein n=1 Tax=Escallonia herrerae TaxID=1293975 RepID=A0AA88W2G4_9ASTE|nr:hypothetical protein RJ639_003925 [Escallonia herrerae]
MASLHPLQTQFGISIECPHLIGNLNKLHRWLLTRPKLKGEAAAAAAGRWLRFRFLRSYSGGADVGICKKLARTTGISVDHRRRNRSLEGYLANTHMRSIYKDH